MATHDSSGIAPPATLPISANLRLVGNQDGFVKSVPSCVSEADKQQALLVESHTHMDVYKGTAEQLSVASLAQPHELPGQLGLPKRQASYLPDGTLRVGKSGPSITDIPGARVIRKLSAHKFEVWLMVSEPEQARRIETRAKDRETAEKREEVDAHQHCIEKIKAEMALPDSEIVALHRESLQRRLEIHQEWLDKALATIGKLSGLRAGLEGRGLTLAYSAGRGL
jgi:hypothetical protein